MKIWRLDEGWRLCQRPLEMTADQLGAASRDWQEGIACSLPCDVHMPLIQNGVIRDPVVADYCYESEWMERRSWWFFREFEADAAMLEADLCELVISAIDTHAHVFLDGTLLGVSESVHLPFVRDLKPYLTPGMHLIAVRVTNGLELVTDAELAEVNWATCHEKTNGYPDRGDYRRAFVRRPQYTTGWDWNPRITTCGIVGHASIRAHKAAVIRGVNLQVKSLQDPAIIQADVEIESLDYIGTHDGAICVELCREGKVCAQAKMEDVLLCSGTNIVTLTLTLNQPQLWWPNGMGDQPLYDVNVRAQIEGHTCEYPALRFGVRTVALDLSRKNDGKRAFTIVVNGVPIFCKGADWVPCDSIYARVTDEKYKTLLRGARDANMNMLRVWGGGIYEPDVFYETCDELGLLIWQDYMFGCTTNPDHREEFVRLCEQEMTVQTRRLRTHACLALLCGNNENHMLFPPDSWGLKYSYERQFGLRLANIVAPQIVRVHAPQIPYWNSSPYGGAYANADEVGDVHHWGPCMMNAQMENRIDPMRYDEAQGRFISEYGYPGPTSRRTMEEYFDHQPIDKTTNIWRIHTNTFEKKTVLAGIEKHYRAGDALELDDYILYAGLVQSLMLRYSLEAFRFKENCSGGLFWMFNDCWGEVGWTILDYACRRKIAYYGVKRAFEPVKLILRAQDSVCSMLGANDTAQEVRFTAKVGYLSFDGKVQRLETQEIIVPPHSRTIVYTCDMAGADLTRGTVVCIPEADIEPAWLYTQELRKLALPEVKLVQEAHVEGDDLLVTVYADGFVSGVHFDEDFVADDNYFDLLPGQERTIRIHGAAKEKIVLRAAKVEAI